MVAFNVFSWKGVKVEPIIFVPKLADRHNISLSSATLPHISFADKSKKGRLVEVKNIQNEGHNSLLTIKKETSDLIIPVIMVTLGYLTNLKMFTGFWHLFHDSLMHILWRKRWTYMALNHLKVP